MNTNNSNRVPLTGYSDRLSARPGESIEFKLSAVQPEPAGLNQSRPVNTWLTQCICADPNPASPGIIERCADEWYERRSVQVDEQEFQSGSYGRYGTPVNLKDAVSIELRANVWPTLQTDSIQCIASLGALALCIGPDMKLHFHAAEQQFICEQALELRAWAHVSAQLDVQHDKVVIKLQWQSIPLSANLSSGELQEFQRPAQMLDSALSQSAIVAFGAQADHTVVQHFYNGKIELPAVTLTFEAPANNQTLSWDFSQNISSCTVTGLSDACDELTLINYPARAMTGSLWRGQEMSWRHAPELYGAIHFHDDDLVDVAWDTTFTWQVPDNMPSGVYLMHISDGTHHDAMPVFICASVRQANSTYKTNTTGTTGTTTTADTTGTGTAKPKNKLCVLIPTFTYAIYGNHARPDWDPSWQEQVEQWGAYPYNPAEYPGYGLSTYNFHSDGSGICHASHHRPLFNLRPGYITFGNTDCSGLRHFQADSHLFAWLDAMQIEFDVVTDHELHNEGVKSISDYAMLMTTSHPEYHTSETLDALTQYRDTGGHLSYLGGNGFYWRIALHPEHNDTLEIRRAEDGIRAWAAESGEYYQAFDGQYGGLWRRNGRPPQALCGLGFSAQGQFNGSYYRKRAVDDSLSWIFAGIDDEIIGDFGLCGGGAAGFELDRADTRLGTPAGAHIIASSENHSDDFILVPEEMLTHITTLPGPDASDLIRADILWCDVAGGGSQFSVGSITFCGSLPHNEFQNSVSTLLMNVVKHVLKH